MGRKRVAGVRLPKGVEQVRARGRTYYYWNPGRVHRPAERTHSAAERRRSSRRFLARSRTTDFRCSNKFPVGIGWTSGRKLSCQRRVQVEVGLDAIKLQRAPQKVQCAGSLGTLNVRDLTAAGVLAARDALKATPGMANHMLACGRTLWNWSIPLDFADANPFERIKPFETPDRGHVPWPQWVTDYIITHASPDLVRLIRLGIMTCQRESDLIRLGPGHRERDGIWCRPKKTRRRRRAFFIPLQTADAH